MSDGFVRAFELAVVPTLFGLAGYWLDGRIGVKPLFTIVLVILAIVGMAARIWYGYDYQMRQWEADRLASSPARPKRPERTSENAA